MIGVLYPFKRYRCGLQTANCTCYSLKVCDAAEMNLDAGKMPVRKARAMLADRREVDMQCRTQRFCALFFALRSRKVARRRATVRRAATPKHGNCGGAARTCGVTCSASLRRDDGLRLQKCLQTKHAKLPPQSGLLQPTERREKFGLDAVDQHRACFQLRRDALRPPGLR